MNALLAEISTWFAAASRPAAVPVVAPIAMLAGFAAGLVHFHTLKGVASRLVSGEMAAIPLQIARLVALGAALFLAALAGPVALIAATVGILLARRRVIAQSEQEP